MNFFMDDQFIKLSIRGISLSKVYSETYVLLLEEESYGRIKLPILIENQQAKSILFFLNKKMDKNEKSLFFTHDLFLNFSNIFNINLKSVIIDELINGIFFSSLIFENKKFSKNIYKKEKKIKSKTSDAIALAVRFSSPVYVTKNVINKIGISTNNNFFIDLEKEISKIIETKNVTIILKNQRNLELENMTINDLQNLLYHAVKKEYYELAAIIKKELDKRNKN